MNYLLISALKTSGLKAFEVSKLKIGMDYVVRLLNVTLAIREVLFQGDCLASRKNVSIKKFRNCLVFDKENFY